MLEVLREEAATADLEAAVCDIDEQPQAAPVKRRQDSEAAADGWYLTASEMAALDALGDQPAPTSQQHKEVEEAAKEETHGETSGPQAAAPAGTAGDGASPTSLGPMAKRFRFCWDPSGIP